MSSSPAHSDPANDASPAPASQRDEDTQYYREVLNDVVAMATGLARTIQRRSEGGEAETLHAELCERLDEPDLDDDLDAQPVDEIIKAICRDLGIAYHLGTHPWKRRTPADVRDFYTRAAQLVLAQLRTADPRPTLAPPPRPRPGTGPPRP